MALKSASYHAIYANSHSINTWRAKSTWGTSTHVAMWANPGHRGTGGCDLTSCLEVDQLLERRTSLIPRFFSQSWGLPMPDDLASEIKTVYNIDSVREGWGAGNLP